MNGKRWMPTCRVVVPPVRLHPSPERPPAGPVLEATVGTKVERVGDRHGPAPGAVGARQHQRATGRSTRSMSATLCSGCAVCSMHSDEITTSNDASGKGSIAASLATVLGAPFSRARRSNSTPISMLVTRAPRPIAASVKGPVPQPTSSTLSPVSVRPPSSTLFEHDLQPPFEVVGVHQTHRTGPRSCRRTAPASSSRRGCRRTFGDSTRLCSRMTKRGRFRLERNSRPRYSPMMPSVRS